MRYLWLILLAACSPHRAVVIWVSARAGGEERIEVRSNGDIQYMATNGGVEDKPESAMRLTKDQVRELGDLLRSQRACELTHDPGYAPEVDESQTTLAIAFPDQQCKVTLWNGEWQRGRARDIADTMRSMRLRPH
jgi:hypothetical protein